MKELKQKQAHLDHTNKQIEVIGLALEKMEAGTVSCLEIIILGTHADHLRLDAPPETLDVFIHWLLAKREQERNEAIEATISTHQDCIRNLEGTL